MAQDSPTSTAEPKPPKKKLSSKMLLVVIIVILIALFAWAEKNRRDAARELAVTNQQLEELRQSSSNENEETANQVRANIAALINIPTDPQPTVALINDIERLRESNEFFNKAENGDYLILTGNRAILYNLDRNIILDVAPFRITQTSPSPGTSPGELPEGTPEVLPTPAS